MDVYKTRAFHTWARKENLIDRVCREAAEEVNQGLVDASLGGGVVKKRIALPGRGKRSGVRALVAFRRVGKAFFIYGFTKNEQTNIKKVELQALRKLAKQLLGYSDNEIKKAVKTGVLLEVR